MKSIKSIKLTNNSWINVHYDILKYTKEEFEEFWNMHPTEHHEVMIYGKLLPIPRWQCLYGNASYNFSGTVSKGIMTVPEFVNKCFEVSRKLYPDYKWNGALVNWYNDGSNYIGAHSDDEKDLVDNSPILSFSFGAIRTFRIKKKIPAVDKEIQTMDFPTIDNSLIVMGSMQKEYKHEITKTAKIVGRRINVTIRCFKSQNL